MDESALKELLGSSSGDARKCARRISKAKKSEYPRRSTEDWTKHSYAASDLIKRLRSSVTDTVTRVQASELTEEEFCDRFERGSQPCVVGGLCEGWDAQSKWSLVGLLKDYGGEKFKVGEDDDGYAVYVKLKYFLRYMLETNDDSPLYVFDSSFAERAVRSRWVQYTTQH
jgi:histone arginine demethylase JMJD6